MAGSMFVMYCSSLGCFSNDVVGRHQRYQTVGGANKLARLPRMEGDDTRPSRLKQMPTWLIAEVSGHAHRLVAHVLPSANSRGYAYRLLAPLPRLRAASQPAVA